ncbi:MAG TPA: hypothetical protein VNL18_12990 [Gemmatimonadales bacterium]|nr:hypothetical protein [Gemmatimonadales bacterium]
MTISAKLSRRLYETLGDDAAGDMVDWMQRIDTQRAELRELNELNFARFDDRFARMDERFVRIDQQFARIDERFARIDERFAQIDERFAQIDERFAQIDERFARIDERLTGIDEQFARMRQDMELSFARLETRIERRTADIMKWSLAFWIGSVVTLVGALRLLP